MMPGAIDAVMAPEVSETVVRTTNCFRRPRDTLVSGSTSFTFAMLMTSPALSVVPPDTQPLVASENDATNALPAPLLLWPAPLTTGAAVAPKVPITWVGIFVLRNAT